MFYFGIQAYKNKWIEQLTYKHAFTWIIIWILARIFLHPLGGDMLSNSFTVIGMSVFIIYSFKLLFNTTNKWARLLSTSSYAAYVIQAVPLCFIGKIYLPYMTQFPLVNFLIIGIPSTIFSFILAYFICKLSLFRGVF